MPLPVSVTFTFHYANMSDMRKSFTTVIRVYSKLEPYLHKSVESKMNHLTLYILLLVTGLTMAYLAGYLPAIFVSIFNGKRQLTNSEVLTAQFDTSIIKRTRQQTIPVNPDVKKEALSAMNLALDMEAQGKHDKAQKLFQHAVKLDPLHADILTAYGEFLEHHEKDVMKAEQLYTKALYVCPEHSKALVNKQRIQPLVEEIDQVMYNAIDKKLDLLYKVPSHHPGLRRQKKEAYFQHIYHTNAIEGNTLTFAQTRSIIETRLAVGGKSLVEQNEVLGLDAALSYVNNTLLGKVGKLTLHDILEIHKRVLGYVDPTEAGVLRTTQVFVGEFTPPGPLDVPQLMKDFIDWLNSEDVLRLHPVEFAALAHYKLVVIHPFYDGNGRTSRLLMNLILMQAGFPPVTIKVEERLRYYEALNDGNQGDLRTFIRFIAECTERTLDEFILATVENAHAVIPKSDWRKNYTIARSERVIEIDP